MASSRSAPEVPHAQYEVYGPSAGDTWNEWNPTEETVRPVRGRHRVAKQRSGMARSGAVLGVGMVAAIGAGGMATAQAKTKAPLSVPDLATLAGDIPVAEALLGEAAEAAPEPVAAPLTQAALTAEDTAAGQTDAGEALRARILQQADHQQSAAEREVREAAEAAAASEAADAAAETAEAERKAEEERQRKLEEERQRKAEEERLRKLAASYTLPLSGYQLTSSFGDSGAMWASNHTGQDFAAPTGTPLKAVHTGTIKEAGWAGSYGYRIVLELADGTEVWYCHLSSMTRTSGQVTTGDVIGRVGSTGNSSGPHLHMEVRPGGGDPVDPLTWLRSKGQNI
ncbi:M23 family metallopeptidase [Streptomyces sp. TRM 70351]|uniref:M23 family metallopeptidase n=1 Tax=Streptomyces sp. TRM 70351 TaxID=3116552 RepID=UPI002E7B68DE|nr:M23 family metallopeptidase [Streptomyces sp. TRM 70351]MEE1929780.1 M23 family metallopeptidase [Streptomyces sp. TRM 70351]